MRTAYVQDLPVASTVEAVGLFCPLPIVKLKLEMEELARGRIIKILADDPAFEEDLISWCRETGNTLISITRNEEDIFVAYVEKS